MKPALKLFQDCLVGVMPGVRLGHFRCVGTVRLLFGYLAPPLARPSLIHPLNLVPLIPVSLRWEFGKLRVSLRSLIPPMPPPPFGYPRLDAKVAQQLHRLPSFNGAGRHFLFAISLPGLAYTKTSSASFRSCSSLFWSSSLAAAALLSRLSFSAFRK